MTKNPLRYTIYAKETFDYIKYCMNMQEDWLMRPLTV